MNKEILREHLYRHHLGRSRSVSSRELERSLHTSGNTLREQVNRLRREGIPIASDQNGYFYAATAGEVYETIRGLEKLRDGLNAAIRGLESSLHDFPGTGR